MECIVEFDYTASQSDELTIKKGDLIRNVISFEDGWKKGWLNGKEGVFPDNFVRVLKSASYLSDTHSSFEKETNLTNKETSMIPIMKVQSNSTNDLLNCKPLFQSSSPLLDKKNFLTNILPNAEKKKWLSNSLTSEPVSMGKSDSGKSEISKCLQSPDKHKIHFTESSKENKHVIVIFDYKAENPDELQLVEGDIVKVLDKNLVDDGWWKGIKKTGEIGIFPSNFVQTYQDNVAVSLKKSAAEDTNLPKPSDNSSIRDQSNVSGSISFNDISNAQKVSTFNKGTNSGKKIKVAFKTKNVYANSCSVESLSELAKCKRSLDITNKSQNSIFKIRPLNGHPESSKGDDTSNSLERNFEGKTSIRSRAASPAINDGDFYLHRSDFEKFRQEVDQKMTKLSMRIQSLVDEIDEEKKQRAASEIELCRLRRVVHMLDAQSLTGIY